MDTNFQQHIPDNFHDNSKVWVYQCNRLFSMTEALMLEPILNSFVETWKSHGAVVKGFATLLFGQFILIMADETQATVGGCSTDASVRVIKEIEQTFKVDLFNRTTLAFIVKDKVQLLPLQQLQYAADNGFINANTLYFNNLVSTKQMLMEQWLQPVGDSWLANKISFNNQVV